MTTKTISKQKRNAIIARFESTTHKYGFETVRAVWNRYIADIREREKLKKTIQEKEQALIELKKRSRL